MPEAGRPGSEAGSGTGTMKTYSADDARVGLREAAASTHNKLSKYSRSVDNIMDKIDVELSRLKPVEISFLDEPKGSDDKDDIEEECETAGGGQGNGVARWPNGDSSPTKGGRKPPPRSGGAKLSKSLSTEGLLNPGIFGGVSGSGAGHVGTRRLGAAQSATILSDSDDRSTPTVLREPPPLPRSLPPAAPRASQPQSKELRLSKELQDILGPKGTEDSAAEDASSPQRQEPDLGLNLPTDYDIDSDFAMEINERYGEIMKNKQVSHAQPLTSFLSSSAKKLPSRPEGYPVPRRARSLRLFRSKPSKTDMYEVDSVKTEDFINAFRATAHTQRKATAENGAEVDSPRTEDYESRFNSCFVKQLAGVPITGFDPATVDSDLDTVKSDLINGMLKKDTETLADLSDLETDFLPPTGRATNGLCGETDSEADLAHEITEASGRIKRELELERMSKGLLNASPEALRDPSGTAMNSGGAAARGGSSGMAAGSSCKKLTSLANGRIGSHRSPSEVKSSYVKDYTPPRSRQQIGLNDSMTIQDETQVLEELGATIKNAHREKMGLIQEVNQLQDALDKLKEDVRRAQDQVKDNRSRAEEARSQLMLADFKKETVFKELSRLTSEVDQKKDRLKELDAKVKAQNVMGVCKEEFADLVEERNQLRNIVNKQNGTLQLEKETIERQYDASKAEMANLQKTYQTQVGALEEVVDTLKDRLHDSQTEQAELLKRCQAAEGRITQDQANHTEAVKEKIRECEELREQSKRDLLESRLEHSMEVTRLNKKISTEEDKSKKLEEEATEHQAQLSELREQLTQAEKEVANQKEILEKQKGCGA